MKSIIIAVFLVLISCVLVVADQLTLAWDPNDPTPDGYKLFQKIGETTYDYLSPVTNDMYQDGIIPGDVTTFTTQELQIPDLISPNPVILVEPVWSRTENTITLEWNQPTTNIDLIHYFVVRAFVGEDESGDSNEVSHTVSNAVLVNYWVVYYSETSGGPWTALSTIQNAGQATPTITDPLTVVQSGEIKTIYFTVVSFVDDTLYSQNAQETSVIVDKRIAVPPTNLTKTVVIPVP